MAKAKAVVRFPYYKRKIYLSLLETPGVSQNGGCVAPEQELANHSLRAQISLLPVFICLGTKEDFYIF